nr:MAG TPA: hypothetical protein [Caudoviricetes sp.]
MALPMFHLVAKATKWAKTALLKCLLKRRNSCISLALVTWLKSLPKLKSLKKVSVAVKKLTLNRKSRPLILKRLNNDDRPFPT